MSKHQNMPATGVARDARGRIAPGSTPNPGGRPKKTPDMRAAEEYLRNHTLQSAKRLVKLTGSRSAKVALRALGIHLKITIGTLERTAGPDGEPLDFTPPLTNDERRELLNRQLADERTDEAKTSGLQNAPPVK